MYQRHARNWSEAVNKGVRCTLGRNCTRCLRGRMQFCKKDYVVETQAQLVCCTWKPPYHQLMDDMVLDSAMKTNAFLRQTTCVEST